jgi:transcriptional regulator GlxA family with amidase domain
VGDDLIEASIHYMKENIERQITLQMLAEYTGYSATHFTKLFKQKTGYSPMNYFNLLKMQKACFMLGESNIKINQVSRKLGINDPYSFSRLFTKIVGLPPTDYREHLKQ